MDEKELDKMAKDIEPIEEPKAEAEPVAPAGFVEDKETYVKPDGETTTAPERNATVIKEESGAVKWVLGSIMTLFILGLGASAAWLYNDAQNSRSELQSVKTGLDAARADAARLRADAAKPATEPATGKDFVDESTVTAAALNSVEAFMSTKGVTRMTYEAKIPYMDDKFARVYVDYTVPDSTNGKNKPSGKGEVFYFKKVTQPTATEASWAMIAINPMTTDEITSMKNRYGVTEEVITGSNPR